MSSAAQHKHILKQGDYKNSFCNLTLLADEITIVWPPIGIPDVKEDKYWLLKKILHRL